jgi:hypothetical protein
MVLLAAGFGAWRAHLLGEVAAKMKALSALLHWERRLLAGALAGWHAGAALARGRATLELLAVRHYVAGLYLKGMQVGGAGGERPPLALRAASGAGGAAGLEVGPWCGATGRWAAL